MWGEGINNIPRGFAGDVTAQLMLDGAQEAVVSGEAPNLQEALWSQWMDFNAFWLGRGVSVAEPCFTNNTIQYFSSHDFPTLATRIKAARCKQMFIWSAEMSVSRAKRAGATRYCQERAALAHSLLSYVEICADADLFLTDAEARAAQRAGEEFLHWYQHLAAQAFAQGRCAWKLRPKLHYFAHVIHNLLDTKENMCKVALWGGEDLVGQIKKVGNKCHQRTACSRVSQRRGLFLWLRAKRAHEWAAKASRPRKKRKLHN